jgi:acetolactate synthase-1/2/3 large subunit
MQQKEASVTEKSGADILIEALSDLGVEVIFGYPGGAVLPIYDALFKQDRIRHILVRHEQAATHAAEGYARSTGKPGVVLVTSGPGATNAVTGITDALMDSIPMVVITGQVPTALIGTDAFQEADTVGITRHCTKHNYLVKAPETLGSIIHEAFHIATSGRPGPVDRALRGAGSDPAQDLSSADPARCREDPGSGRYARRGRAADLLHRRRDHQFGA